MSLRYANPPVLYALDVRGRTLSRVEVKGASRRDWEDITLDARGNLSIGDIESERDEPFERRDRLTR